MVIFIDFFFKFINKYGLFLIYSFIFLEYSCFPLPSEVILPTAGAFAQSNNINVFLIILFSIFISLLASIICYLIGRFGNKYFLPKIQKKMNKSISTCLNYFNKYGSLSICFGRLIPLCRTYISFFAGLNKFNIFKYILYSSIGIGLWNTILILLGYNFYNNLDFIIEIYNKYTIIIVAILFILAFIYLLKKYMRYQNERRKNFKNKCNANSWSKEN